MKLKTLGFTLVTLLAASAMLLLLVLALLAHQFELALLRVERSYAGLVLPLRQIDANTKHLRFHLYAAYMHNPQLPVASLHEHPLALHLQVIETELRNNQQLWAALAAQRGLLPPAALETLQRHYVSFIEQGVAPSLRAARSEDWNGIVRPITATLPQYLNFEAALQQQTVQLRQHERQRFQQLLAWQQGLFACLALLVLGLVSAAAWLAWRTIARHDALLVASNRQLAEANEDLERKVARRTLALEQANCDLERLLRQLQATQNQLVQSEKLAGMGRLVAGVAHELNTPIGNGLLAVTTLADQAVTLAQAVAHPMRRTDLQAHLDLTRHCCGLVQRALERAGQLVHSFKLLAADPRNEQRQSFALSQVLATVLQERRADLQRHACAVSLQLVAEARLDSYPASLMRVLHSVLDNALLHAFEGRTEASIVIRSEPGAGQWVALAIVDNGCGMAPAILARVFEPFFTTRPGQGSGGLGLTIAHNTVTTILGGRIALVPAVPGGTRVELALPLLAPVHGPSGGATLP